MSSPLVSIIVTSYNHARYLGAALDSVYAQRWKNIEVIVVDDASTDGSQKIIKQYQKRKGLHAILRDSNYYSAPIKSGDKPIIAAMKQARGDYIAVVDSDDLILPHKLSIQVALLEKHPDCVMCYGGIEVFNDAGEVSPYSDWFASGDQFPRLLTAGNITLYIGTLIRRSAFDQLQPSHPELVQEDWDMFLRLAHLGPFIADPRPVARYRRHGNNTWYRRDRMALMYRNRMMILDHWREHLLWPQAIQHRWDHYLQEVTLEQDDVAALLRERPHDALLHFLTFRYHWLMKEPLAAKQAILLALKYCDSRLSALALIYQCALNFMVSEPELKYLMKDMAQRLPHVRETETWQNAEKLLRILQDKT